MLAGIAPDVDVFIRSATDPLMAVEFHRHFTHSLAFAPLGALVVVGLVYAWRRNVREQLGALWCVGLAAWVSHCLLDAMTSYGTLLWWPFNRDRVGWDVISIIDPWFTLPLLAAVVMAVRLGRRWVAAAGLAWAACVLALGGVQKQRALAIQERIASARGHAIVRAEVMPAFASQTVWRSLYESDGRLHSDRIRVPWWGRVTWVEGASLDRVTHEDLTGAERARNEGSRAFERFEWFSDGWLARAPGAPEVIGDMRYSMRAEAFEPIWGIVFTPPGEGPSVRWVSRSRERRIELARLWKDGTE
jgi:inner membrane protein